MHFVLYNCEQPLSCSCHKKKKKKNKKKPKTETNSETAQRGVPSGTTCEWRYQTVREAAESEKPEQWREPGEEGG